MTYKWLGNCCNVSPVECWSLRYHKGQTKIGLSDLSRSKIRRMTLPFRAIYFMPTSVRKFTNEYISATESGRPVANACLPEGPATGTKAIGHLFDREPLVNRRLQDHISRRWRTLNRRLMRTPAPLPDVGPKTANKWSQNYLSAESRCRLSGLMDARVWLILQNLSETAIFPKSLIPWPTQPTKNFEYIAPRLTYFLSFHVWPPILLYYRKLHGH